MKGKIQGLSGEAPLDKSGLENCIIAVWVFGTCLSCSHFQDLHLKGKFIILLIIYLIIQLITNNSHLVFQSHIFVFVRYIPHIPTEVTRGEKCSSGVHALLGNFGVRVSGKKSFHTYSLFVKLPDPKTPKMSRISLAKCILISTAV